MAEKNSNISLNFTLNGDCKSHNEFWIKVARVQKTQEEREHVIEGDVCTFWNSGSTCTPIGDICSCSKGKGVYTLRKTVEKHDNTTWVWRTDPNVAEVKKLLFIVSDKPENKTDDSHGRVSESNSDTTFSIQIDSSTIADHSKTETDYILITESDPATSLHTWPVTSRKSDAPAVHSVTAKTDAAAPVPFLYGVDFMVVTSVGILALAGAVTAITIVCVRRGRRSDERRRSSALAQLQPMNALEVLRPQEDNRDEDNEDNVSRRFSQETNFYWEVRDDPPTPSPELPRPCLRPALPDDYLHPAVSRGVMEGTDDAKKVTPLYENSTLREANTSQHEEENPNSSAIPASEIFHSAETLKRHVEVNEFENKTEEDPESGYMPMTGTVRRVDPAAAQATVEGTVAARNSSLLYENASAVPDT